MAPIDASGAPTPAQFRLAARTWLEEQRTAGVVPDDWGPILPARRRDEGVAWQARLHAAGFAAISWPSHVGGRGLSPEHEAVWLEECGRAGAPAVLNMVGLVLAAQALLRFGTEDQRDEHLPPTARGERIWCQLFSEPGAGSDLASMTTRAERDGDRWVVNGQKVWSSGARISDMALLLARSDAEAPRHAGISMFLLDLRTPGVDIRPLRQMTGGSEFDEVFLTDVEVPQACLLGPLHGGWGVAVSALTNERGFIGSAVTGLARRVEEACRAGEADAVSRQRLARLYERAHALQSLRDRQGAIASVASSLLKLGMTDLSFDLAMTAATLAGLPGQGLGPIRDSVLGAPGARLGGGTSEIQRSIIGERVLGLPPEPKAPR